MRILFVHNFYQEQGGEDRVFKNELALLRKYKHEAAVFSVSNNSIKGNLGKIRAAWHSPYCKEARQKLYGKIGDFRPDLVHVHNFFPLLTPSVYDACRRAGIPVVQTLHNYRTICPGALLMRDGNICEKCVRGSAYKSVRHCCYRGSRLGTVAVARMVESHRKRHTWHQKVDRFIALTEFARKKFIEGGLPANKIVLKPNFCRDSNLYSDSVAKKPNASMGQALFVGRLSHEKGIYTLLKAWWGLNITLRVVGKGTLYDWIKENSSKHVKLLGHLTSNKVGEEMDNALFLIMPSECYESFGMVLIEAFSHGLPVVASRLGSMEEIVEDGTTGLLFEAGNVEDLAEKAIWMVEHPNECRRMGENARRIYKEQYVPEKNYKMLMKIYQDVLSEK